MKEKKFLWMLMITFIGVLCVFGNSKDVEARKYYSLQEIGLSGCTTDAIDYSVVSIRGNTLKYIKYQYYLGTCEWKQVGGVRSAKLNARTKYYMGNGKKVPSSLRKNGVERFGKNMTVGQLRTLQQKHILRKTTDINTQKWIYRVRKGTIKRNIFGRHSEVQIVNGKVTKLAVKLEY